MTNSTRVIAIDLAKSVFQVCLFERQGEVLSNRTMRRAALSAFLAKQQPALVAMEACSGAHYWGRKAQSLGHRVVIIPPKQVSPYRQGQKTDGNDALAIGIASRQTVRLGRIGRYTGDQRLRSSLIIGARAAVNALMKRPPKNTKEQWLKGLIERRGPGRAAVALANKNVRTAWSMLRYHTEYQPTLLSH